MPVTMSGYGQSYMPMGGPAVGDAIYSAQRQQVNFARMVELEKLNLQKRALRQQAAAQAAQLAQREQARQDELSMQQTRFDLEERRLDMQDQERQQRRQDILDAYERAEQQRLEQEEQAIREERNKLTSVGATVWDGQGERPKQHYTLRDGTVYDLTGVDMGRVRGSSPQQAGALNMDAIRKELNTLSAQGARLLRDDETYDQRTHYPYIGADGRVWLIQRTDKNGNPIVHPEEQPKPSPVEGYDSEEEYLHYYNRYGEKASSPQIVGKLKQIDLNLKNKARQLGVVEVVAKPGEKPKEEWSDYSLDKLRDLANTEKKAQADAKLTGQVKTPWQDELKKAEAMVELHDAKDALLNQNLNHPQYRAAVARNKKLVAKMNTGQIGRNRIKAGEFWRDVALPQYQKKVASRYMEALENARKLGWDIPKGRKDNPYAFIDGLYDLLIPKK